MAVSMKYKECDKMCCRFWTAADSYRLPNPLHQFFHSLLLCKFPASGELTLHVNLQHGAPISSCAAATHKSEPHRISHQYLTPAAIHCHLRAKTQPSGTYVIRRGSPACVHRYYHDYGPNLDRLCNVQPPCTSPLHQN